MRRWSLFAVCAVSVFSFRCLLQDPRQVSAGGEWSITRSAATAGASDGTYEAKSIAGFYNGGDRKPGTDAGFSLVSGTPNPLDQETCKGMSLGFIGKPEAGKSWQLSVAFPKDAGLSADGGVVDAGIGGFANGLGTFFYFEGCPGKTETRNWRSTGGTLTVNTVEAPEQLPPDAKPDANKTVTFTLSNVTMAPDDSKTTGTFTANGSGEVMLFTGMDQ